MAEQTTGGGIRILPPDISRRIAAGEVIDRPFSVVRELLDNAVDAGALEITVRLESGGLDSITVSDNGSGMTADDLALCYRSHATSKISDLSDLESVRTLGFRGEALSSIGNVSHLRITSAADDSGLGHEVVVRGSRRVSFDAVRAPKGTTVVVRELFFNLPARKKFVKSVSAESNLCRTALVEKAIAHPQIGFRLFTEGNLKLYLPPDDPVGRVAKAHERLLARPTLHHVSGSAEGVEVEAVIADPSVSRGDRKLVQVYVNGRRIAEYAFVQAVEYAYDQFLPGGRLPVAFVFLRVEPQRVDFNVHPAKKEARFQNRSEIRGRIVDVVRSFLLARERKAASAQSRAERDEDPPALPYEPSPVTVDNRAEETASRRPRYIGERSDSAPTAGERPPHRRPTRGYELDSSPVFSPQSAVSESSGIRYLGQVFGLFLVAQIESTLYIVDQHAAHERILFERARSQKGRQPLLVPILLELSPHQDKAFERFQPKLAELGFEASRVGDNLWEVSGIPEAAADLAEETLREILESVADVDYEKWEWEFYAEIACKAAVKDGAALDAVTARELLGKTFSLPHPRCPHGRPLWFEISREELFALVGRT